jgi:lysozyme
MTIVSLLFVFMLLATFISAVPAGAAACTWTHRVRFGDTLGMIARYYGTTVTDIQKLNNIANPNVIYWGSNLCVSDTQAPPAPFPNKYTVKWGDTLGYIAWRFGANLGDLVRANGIGNANVIFAGETITVPAAP